MVNRNKNGKAQTVMRSRRAEIWPAVGEGAVTIPPAFNSACDAEVLARRAHAQHGVRGLTTKERSWKVALLPRYQCQGINARVSMPVWDAPNPLSPDALFHPEGALGLA